MADDLTDDQIAEAISAMDARWNGQGVRCQCPVHDHKPKGCDQPATVIAVRHLVNHCKGPEANEAGNRVEVLCLDCARDMWVGAHAAIADLKAAAARVGGHPICCGCLTPMLRPSDIVLSVARYDGGIR